MNKKEMPDSITLNGKRLPLLIQFPVNDHFQIGVYQGTLSDFDMIVRYKQLLDGKWTRARTPKHIHWAVDILIKQHENPEATNRFLDFLLKHWNSVTPLLSEAERKKVSKSDAASVNNSSEYYILEKSKEKIAKTSKSENKFSKQAVIGGVVGFLSICTITAVAFKNKIKKF